MQKVRFNQSRYRFAFLSVLAIFASPSCSETEYKIVDRGAEAGAGANQTGSAGEAGHEVTGGTSSKAGSSGRGGSTTSRGGSPSTGGVTVNQGGTSAQGGVSSVGGSSTGGTTNTGPLCGLAPNPTDDRSKRRLLVRDEATSRLALVDVGNASNSWDVVLDREDGPEDGDPAVSQGRDLQLVGNCRVLVGTHLGYDEYDLLTHQRVAEVTAFPGTIAAQRLRNKNTLIVGVGTVGAPWQGQVGIVLIQVDGTGKVVGSPVVYPGTYSRLVRETPQGTFLVANNQQVFEGDATGVVLSPTFIVPQDFSSAPQAWMGVRITTPSGARETIVATGNDARLRIYNADGSIRKTITGGTGQVTGGALGVEPLFFAGLQVLPNGNYLVTNSSGSVSGNFTKRLPILEYNPAGALVWYWGDPAYADRLSGIHAALVLDGLDPTKLNVEGTDGKLTIVN
jgi:hypothetical protein